MATVLIPIPRRDFDPTEVAVSWQVLASAGHSVVFATPDGLPGRADEIVLTGQEMDPWGLLPLLRHAKLLGLILRAGREARAGYAALERDAAFQKPRRWEEVRAEDYDGLLLPGGHRARGIREYLESETLKRLVAAFFEAEKPVAAVCHGVLLAARSVSPRTGRSILYGRRTTGRTWRLERAAWILGRIGRFWDPGYYRTYPELSGEPPGYRSVQAEVERALARPDDFHDVPRSDPHYWRKTLGVARDGLNDPRPAFVVRDGNYVSARWPGDVFTFARTFATVLDDTARRPSADSATARTEAASRHPAGDSSQGRDPAAPTHCRVRNQNPLERAAPGQESRSVGGHRPSRGSRKPGPPWAVATRKKIVL